MYKRRFGLLPKAGKSGFTRRARADAEARAATLKAITESRELMAKIDAVMAKVPPVRGIL